MKRLDVGIGYLPTEPMGHSRTVRMVDLGMILMVSIFMLAPILRRHISWVASSD